MPELPEVETVMRGLSPHMTGRKINHLDQRRPDIRFPFPDNFAAHLQGAKITQLTRRAKYILVHLDINFIWMIHLGMSGRFTIEPSPTDSSQTIGHNSGGFEPDKHDHVIVTLDDGCRIIYNDVRRFGYMDLFPVQELETHPSLKNLGPEPMTDAFNTAQITQALENKKSAIKTIMLDQSIVAGLGNIYICEALWRTGINPKTAANKISKKRLESLVSVVKDVLGDAIEAGGSSLKDYRQVDGELGYFQHKWDAYGREGEICRKENCGGTIERFTQGGRSTFYCPTHQK